MPHRDDDDDDRPRKSKSRDDGDKVEVRRFSQTRRADDGDRPKATARPSAIDENDDRPKTSSRRIADDDDDDRPKTQSRRASSDDDDEDDRPKTQSRRASSDDDDDDDRPKTKSRRMADDDDDDDRPSRRARRDYDEDDEDEPRRKKKRPLKKQLNAVGLVSLVIGGIALLLSLTPCVSWIYALIPGLFGVVAGLVGLFVSRQSEGRQGVGLPIAGASINVVAILIAFGLMMLTKKVGEGFEKELKDEIAKAEAREKERKDELAKAGPEVKNAQPGSIIQVTAQQFSRAYENDEERADRMYTNKILEVTGTLQQVDFSDDEQYVVLLRAGRDEFDTVDCHFFKDAAVRRQLQALQPGAQVTIRGKCLGGGSTIEACILIR